MVKKMSVLFNLFAKIHGKGLIKRTVPETTLKQVDGNIDWSKVPHTVRPIYQQFYNALYDGAYEICMMPLNDERLSKEFKNTVVFLCFSPYDDSVKFSFVYGEKQNDTKQVSKYASDKIGLHVGGIDNCAVKFVEKPYKVLSQLCGDIIKPSEADNLPWQKREINKKRLLNNSRNTVRQVNGGYSLIDPWGNVVITARMGRAVLTRKQKVRVSQPSNRIKVIDDKKRYDALYRCLEKRFVQQQMQIKK